jgi:hypothetical protein
MSSGAEIPPAGRTRTKASGSHLGLANGANAGIARGVDSTNVASETASPAPVLSSDQHSTIEKRRQNKSKPKLKIPTTTARLDAKAFSITVKSTGTPPTCSLDFVARLLFSRTHARRKSRLTEQ